MNDPFDSRLAHLLRQERARPDPTESMKSRVFARIQTTVTTPSAHASSAPSATPPALGPGSIVRATVLSVALAAGTAGTLLALRAPAARPRVSSAMRAAEVARQLSLSAPALAGPSSPPSGPVLTEAPAPARAGSVPGSSASGVADLATERLLLDRAREDLLHGEPAGALTSIGEYTRRFPRGVLSEEADALRVEAFVSADRYADARSAASRFHAAHPGSLLTAAVDNALDGIP
jgi:hypothetical protein